MLLPVTQKIAIILTLAVRAIIPLRSCLEYYLVRFQRAVHLWRRIACKLAHFNGISVLMESTLPIIKDYKDYLSSAIVIILLSNKLFQCFADCIYLWFYQYGNWNNIFFLIDINFFRKRFSSFTQSWTLDCFSFPKGKINNWSMQTSAFSPSYPTKSIECRLNTLEWPSAVATRGLSVSAVSLKGGPCQIAHHSRLHSVL